jgi:hypothetical protein
MSPRRDIGAPLRLEMVELLFMSSSHTRHPSVRPAPRYSLHD